MPKFIRPASISPAIWDDMSASHQRKVIESRRVVEFTHRSGHVERMPLHEAWYLTAADAGSVRPRQ